MTTQEHQQPTGDAPQSLEALASLLADIKSGNSPLRLGPSALRVLSAMISGPNQASLYSISHLADHFGVNPSTLTRLAKALGFAGFSEFQDIFRRYTANTGSFYSERADELLHYQSEHHGLDLAAKIASEEIPILKPCSLI